jgi:hypothetical protein
VQGDAAGQGATDLHDATGEGRVTPPAQEQTLEAIDLSVLNEPGVAERLDSIGRALKRARREI